MFTLPTLIPVLIPMKLVRIIMFGSGYSGPLPIAMLIPIPMQMCAVLNLALMSISISFLTDFHCYFASESSQESAQM